MAMLTRAQWRAGPRKSGTYARYAKWYNKKIAPPKGPLAAWTERQIQAKAGAEMAATYGAQKTQLEQEAAQRTATINAASQAASQILGSHAGIAQQGYTQATKDLAGFGAGYSKEMAARVDAAQKAAASFGATQGAPAAAPTVDTGALQDVAFHGAAAIPGSSLASQGAAATSLAAEQAGIPVLQGAADVRANMQQSSEDLLKLAQQRPELRNQILDKLYQREMDKLKVRIQQQAQSLYAAQFGETVRSHKAGERLSAQRNAISYQKMLQTHKDAISKAKKEGNLPNASLSRAYGYIVDQHGHPILDANGKKIPIASSGGSTKDKTAKAKAQYGKAVGEAAKMFGDAQAGAPEIPGAQGPLGKPSDPKRAWRKGNAIRYLQNKYGITRAQAVKALKAGGFTKWFGGSSKSVGGAGNTSGSYGGVGGQ